MKNENPVYVMQTAIGTRYKKLYFCQLNMKLKCNQYLTPVALYGFGRNGDPRPALFRGRLLFHPLFSQAGRLYAAAIQGAGGISPEKRFVSPDL